MWWRQYDRRDERGADLDIHRVGFAYELVFFEDIVSVFTFSLCALTGLGLACERVSDCHKETYLSRHDIAGHYVAEDVFV